MADIDIPVLIVGGGGAGLTASMLLSKLDVPSLLVSALPTTSVLPKAHLLNQRTMEILDDAGVADAIYAAGTPRANMSHTAFYAGFAGWPDAGRRIGLLESWGGSESDLDWEAASPLTSTNLPQIRLEPLMRDHAERLAPGMVRFGHELVSFEQDAEGVTSTVRDSERGEEFTVRSSYLFACDAGRTIGPRLGVEMVGLRDVGSMVSIHISADLSEWATDPGVLIRWLWVPHMGRPVSYTHLDVYKRQLQDPRRLVVVMHGSRERIGSEVALEDNDTVALAPEQARQDSTNRPHTDDGDVVTLSVGHKSPSHPPTVPQRRSPYLIIRSVTMSIPDQMITICSWRRH